jgi:hypothetical protein
MRLAARATVTMAVWNAAAQAPPANRSAEVRRDVVGAWHGSAIRCVADAGTFSLWGFLDYDRDRCKSSLSFGDSRVFFAGKPDDVGGDRMIGGVPAVSGKHPDGGFAPEAAPVLAQDFEQVSG